MSKAESYTARTDFAVVPISKVVPIPQLGATIIDPDFNTKILRVTGPDFIPERAAYAFCAGLGGSADVTVWNRDSRMFSFEDSGGRQYVMSFNPITGKATPLYPDAFPGGTFHAAAALEFSRINGNLLFQFHGPRISEYLFADASKPPSPNLIYDFTPQLDFVPMWQSAGGASSDGKTFAMAYSVGPQGTGSTILIYTVGKGWRKLDTLTGLVTGTYGKLGMVSNSARYTIHNIKMSPSGDYLVITPLTGEKQFWHIATLDMMQVANYTGGHFTSGYKTWVNNGGVPFGQYQKRTFASPASPIPIINPFPGQPQKAIFDSHLSWANCGPQDDDPFFCTTTTTNKDWQLWQHEVLGFAGGLVYRFCHTFNSGVSPIFSIAQEIGCVSQDGRFMLFCSDWMGQTKGDVFIAFLR